MKIFAAFPPESRELIHPIDGWSVSNELLNGISRKASWKPLAVKIVRHDGGSKVRGRSLCPWFCLSHALVFREEVILKLGSYLSVWGEILPLKTQDDPLYIWHPLTIVDALDIDASEVWRSEAGRILDVRRFAFHPHKLPNLDAFKVPELPVCPILFSENAVKTIAAELGDDRLFKLQWSNP